MTKISVYDVKVWIQKLKNKGISRFTFKDLDDDVKVHQTYLKKAYLYGFIKKIRKISGVHRNGVWIWEVNNKRL